MPVQALFKPFQLGALQLSTRVVMAPMTRSFSLAAYPIPKSLSTTAAVPLPVWA